MSDDFDKELAEFTASNRRRNVRVLAVAAIACIAIGIVVAIVGVAARQGAEHTSAEGRGESGLIRMLIYGAAFVVVGCLLGWQAFQESKRK